MVDVFSRLGPVIAEAAKSPLGLLALAIIAVSILTIALFGQAPQNRLVALVVAILATATFTAVGVFGVAPRDPERVGGITGRGYYRDILETRSSGERVFYLAFEDIDWAAYPGNQISGESSGDVSMGGTPVRTVHKVWRESGYRVGDFVFLSYFTSRQEGPNNIPSGIGAYVLRKRGAHYSGYIVIYDTANDVTLECPYVLATSPEETQYTVEQARVRWPQLETPCREVVFPIGN